MTRCFGIDYGGTKVRIAEVDPATGELASVVTLPSPELDTNVKLTSAISDHMPPGVDIGISAAGAIDEQALIIDYAPNTPIEGPTTFGADLAARGHRVRMLNDIRAAAQAEASYGVGRDGGSVAVATYSTGHNSALAVGGRVLPFAPETGHFIYRGTTPLTCGCGSEDHLEPYVSGSGARWLAQRWFVTHPECTEHPILNMAGDIEDIVAQHVYQAYRQDPDSEPQRSIREEQIQAIAVSITATYAFFNPLDHLVLMGSQTRDWEILFVPAIARAHDHAYPGHRIPTISRTALPEIGVQGAVAWLVRALSTDGG
jgi:predicted NBD/HSP70 family sugar kinase